MRKIRVLSIDGGGIKGIGPAHLLIALDAQLKALGKPGVTGSFDLFVGTSTGCIIAAGLAAAKQVKADFTPAGIKDLYYRRGKEMFTRELFGLLTLFRGKYKESAKGRLLRELLGDLTLGQIESNFLGTFYNLGDQPGPVFANGGAKYRQNGDDKYKAVPVWEAVNASSSAPIYFDPSQVDGLGSRVLGADGGIFANNPAMCAYVEAAKMWRDEPAEILVAAFGCGTQKLRFPTSRRWGLLGWTSVLSGIPLLEAMFDGQSQTVSYQMSRILAPGSFFRFEYDLDGFGKVRMDDASQQNMDRIIAAADALLATSQAQQDMLALAEAL